MPLHVNHLRNIAAHSQPRTAAGTRFRFGSMFNGFGFFAQQLFRFVIAALAVIFALMIVWWNLDLNAPVDNRSTSVRIRDEISRAQYGQSLGSHSTSENVRTGLSGFVDELRNIGTSFAVAFDKMRNKDRERMLTQDRDLRSMFNVQPSAQRLEGQQNDTRPSSNRVVLSRGLSSNDLASIRSRARDEGPDQSANMAAMAQNVSREIGRRDAALPGPAIPQSASVPRAANPQAVLPQAVLPQAFTGQPPAFAPPVPQTASPPAGSGFATLAPPAQPIEVQSMGRQPAPPLRGTAAPSAPVSTAAAKGASPLNTERNDVAAVTAALAAAEEDYRAFNRAFEQVRAFLERYPTSNRRQPLIEKIDALNALRARALEERDSIDSNSQLSTVPFDDRDFNEASVCFDAIDALKTLAIVRKAVRIHRNVPAYIVLVDASSAAANPAMPDAVEANRAALGERIGKCLPRQQAAGEMKFMFWPDQDAKSAGPLLAKVEDALIYSRI